MARAREKAREQTFQQPQTVPCPIFAMLFNRKGGKARTPTCLFQPNNKVAGKALQHPGDRRHQNAPRGFPTFPFRSAPPRFLPGLVNLNAQPLVQLQDRPASFFRKMNSGLPYPQNPAFPALTLPARLLRVRSRGVSFPRRRCTSGPRNFAPCITPGIRRTHAQTEKDPYPWL